MIGKSKQERASKVGTALAILLLVLLSGNAALAQQHKFHPEWLAADLKAIELVPRLLPAEKQTVEGIAAVLGEHSYGETEDLGFGAHKISFSKPSGYTSLRVNLFTLNGAIEDYTIRVDGNTEQWPLIRSQIIAAWRESSSETFEENNHSLSYHKSFDPELLVFKKAVAAELGEMRAVQVPTTLKEDYEYLISPLHNSVVGSGGCDYAGTTPAGKVAIDALMKANRVDLLENVLKGFNPGGRVYAALALLSLKSKGLHLSDETQTTIKKIGELDINIDTCSGCIHLGQTAKQILASPPNP